MNFKYKALLLFVILLLGLILCSFLGGNCGINHKEGFTKKTTTSSLNLNTVATYYGPNGNTAQIVKNANNTYSIVVGDCSGNDCSGNDISGNDVSGSMIDCSCNYTIYTSSSTSTSYELTVFYGTNGGVARVIRVDNGNTAIEITLPNGTIELFTITKTPYYTNQNYPKYNSWPTTQPQSPNNYDNYNHYSGLSVSTVYYGPNGATAKVVETAEAYIFSPVRCPGRRLGNVAQRTVAAPRLGQAHAFLGVSLNSMGHWVHKLVGNAIVHGIKAGRAWVGQPSHLDRGGLASEKQEAVVTHMHCQIHQDVDAVLPNLFRQSLIAVIQHIMPHTHIFTKPLRDLIGPRYAGVRMNLVSVPIVCFKQRHYKVTLRLSPEVR